MSFTTWHTYGYGICVDNIKTTTNKIIDFICLAHGYKQEFENDIDMNIEDLRDTPTDEFIYEYSQDVHRLAGHIAGVVEELYGVKLTPCQKYAGGDYVVFEPKYTWDMTKEEKKLTEGDLKQLFKDCIKHLTDQTLDELEYDYHSIEDGG